MTLRHRTEIVTSGDTRSIAQGMDSGGVVLIAHHTGDPVYLYIGGSSEDIPINNWFRIPSSKVMKLPLERDEYVFVHNPSGSRADVSTIVTGSGSSERVQP